jgi:hypothetical protein
MPVSPSNNNPKRTFQNKDGRVVEVSDYVPEAAFVDKSGAQVSEAFAEPAVNSVLARLEANDDWQEVTT